jgi:hypothetical protein
VGRSCSMHASVRNVYKVFDENPERSRPLGTPNSGWKDAIMIDFKEIIWEGLYWVCLP